MLDKKRLIKRIGQMDDVNYKKIKTGFDNLYCKNIHPAGAGIDGKPQKWLYCNIIKEGVKSKINEHLNDEVFSEAEATLYIEYYIDILKPEGTLVKLV